MDIKKQEKLYKVLATCYGIWTLIGSLFSKLSFPQVWIIHLMLISSYILITNKRYIKLDKKVIIFLFFCFFRVFNNSKLTSGLWYWYFVGVFISFEAFFAATVMVDINYKLFLDYYLRIVRFGYAIYAFFTILFKFSKVAFYSIALPLFPANYKVLMSEYSSGYMSGLTNHYSTNGMLLSVGVILCIITLFYKQKKGLKDYIFVVYMITAILLTGKRSDTVSVISALLVCYYVYLSDNPKSRFVKLIGSLTIVSVVFVVVIAIFPDLATFITRFKETAEVGDVTLGRTEMWAIALAEFIQHPVLGIGWGNIMELNYIPYNVHNIYVQLLSENGIIGFSFFVGFFIISLVGCIKLLFKIRKGYVEAPNNAEFYLMISLAVQITFVMYGATGNGLYDKELFMPYFIFVGAYYYFKGVCDE